MAEKPKTATRQNSGLTRPGELYVRGDELPQPEVSEKNTDSVWALWSDLVDETTDEEKGKKKMKEQDAGGQKDFLETVPLNLDELPTQLMDLPASPEDSDK